MPALLRVPAAAMNRHLIVSLQRVCHPTMCSIMTFDVENIPRHFRENQSESTGRVFPLLVVLDVHDGEFLRRSLRSSLGFEDLHRVVRRRAPRGLLFAVQPPSHDVAEGQLAPAHMNIAIPSRLCRHL